MMRFIFCKIYISTCNNIAKKNFQIYSSKNKLRIGYYTTLPFFPAIGDTQKTVLDAKAALESRGHDLVPFEMPDDYHYIQLINTILMADGGKSFREMFANEGVAPAVKVRNGCQNVNFT